jgi:hypothetical protein
MRRFLLPIAFLCNLLPLAAGTVTYTGTVYLNGTNILAGDTWTNTIPGSILTNSGWIQGYGLIENMSINNLGTYGFQGIQAVGPAPLVLCSAGCMGGAPGVSQNNAGMFVYPGGTLYLWGPETWIGTSGGYINLQSTGTLVLRGINLVNSNVDIWGSTSPLPTVVSMGQNQLTNTMLTNVNTVVDGVTGDAGGFHSLILSSGSANNGGTIAVQNNGILSLGVGGTDTVYNNGTIKLTTGGSMLISGNLTLGGSGSVVMGDQSAVIQGIGASVLNVGAQQTISGGGLISNLTVQNAGTINGNGQLYLANATITGGTVSGIAGVVGGYNGGAMTVGSGSTMTLSGTYINAGTIDISGGSLSGATGSTFLQTGGATNITNGGSLTASFIDLQNGTLNLGDNTVSMRGMDSGGNDIAYTQGGGTANIAGAFTTTGAEIDGGVFNVNGGSVTGGAGSTFLQTGGTVNLLNGGSLTASFIDLQNGTLNLGDNTVSMKGFDGGGKDIAYTQGGGTVDINGTLALVDGSGIADLTGGTLGGSGTIDGSLVADGGTVAPGDPTTLTITGDYTETAAGTLELELGGTAPGAYDTLAVGGTATLGGTLDVVLFGGFQPQAGQLFTIITAGQIVGDFSNFEGSDLGNGLGLDEVWNGDHTSLSLEVESHPTGQQPTPEPGTWLMAATGFVLLLAGGRRRRWAIA